MADFLMPDFISGRDVNSIHRSMRENLPANIDTSEGSHPWNLTFPHAYELAYSTQYVLSRAIQLIWPEFAWGEWLDYHAKTRGMERKDAAYATGKIRVSGNPGTEIPEGSVFSTQSKDGEKTVSFETTETLKIGEDGTVDIAIAALVSGKDGNVAAYTIVINTDNIRGITVTNENATLGGLDPETDAELSQRIMEYDKAQDISFVGNSADYKRWAKTVDGVTDAVVLDPEDNPDIEDKESGMVTVIIIGPHNSKDPETKNKACAAVYNKIMDPTPPSTDGTMPSGQKTGLDRLAPLNAKLTVQVAKVEDIIVKATVELDGTDDISGVQEKFITVLTSYFETALNEGEIKYSKVGMCLLQTDGIKDYSELELNGKVQNIKLESNVFPMISEKTLLSLPKAVV